MPYHFLEDVATADIAFEAWGKNLEETFVSAAEATLNVMIEELEAVQPREERELSLEHEHLDMLLFGFLQEIIYYKDAQQLMLRVAAAEIRRQGSVYRLAASARGEKLDPERHHPRVDVKAVTLHRFTLEETPGGWKAHVILDI